jgi:hypothetical protein
VPWRRLGAPGDDVGDVCEGDELQIHRGSTTTTSEIGTAGVERLGVEAEGVGAGVGRGDLDWSAAA